MRRLGSSHVCRPLGQLVVRALAQADGSVARRLMLAADAGDPIHVTGWDLQHTSLTVAADTWVLVCENPRVLEAVAQSRTGGVACVCVSGMPGAVVMEVLRRLARSKTRLMYHGDFDWPAIANRLVATVGALPWLMSAADYEAGVRDDGLVLEGPEVAPVWDRGLGDAMRARGVAVHEEAVLPTLLGELP